MAVGYFQDIQPKFRPGDISCMTKKGIKIGDVDWMCSASASHGFDDHGNARIVFSALSGGWMPPDEAWPQDWIDTYQNWMNDGFQPGSSTQGEAS